MATTALGLEVSLAYSCVGFLDVPPRCLLDVELACMYVYLSVFVGAFVLFECLSVLANKLKFRSCLRIFVRFEYVSTRFRGWLSVVLPDAIRMDVMWDYFGHSPKITFGVLTVLRRSQEGTNMLWLLAECVGTDIVGAMGFRIMIVKAF